MLCWLCRWYIFMGGGLAWRRLGPAFTPWLSEADVGFSSRYKLAAESGAKKRNDFTVVLRRGASHQSEGY